MRSAGADLVAGGGVAEGEAEADEDQPGQDVLDAGRCMGAAYPPPCGAGAGLDQRLPERDLVGEQLASASGVACSAVAGAVPSSAKRSATRLVGDRGLQRALSLASTSGGVPAGA